jgi:hypothetical protein
MLFADAKPYMNFRNVTVAVIAIWLVNFSFSIYLATHWFLPSEMVEQYRKVWDLIRSPFAILGDAAFVGIGFWIARRYRVTHYLACVTVYAMCLANILGFVEFWIFCHTLFDKRS